jgi:hypothetical protein
MHNRKSFLARLIVVPALIVVLNCENPSTEPDTLPDGATRNGFYVVMTPYAGGAINTDSTVVITWNWTTNITDPNVKVSLYKDDTLFRLFSSSTANDGSQPFSFATVTPGYNYRIKISGIIDTSKYDFGGYFSVKNQYFGTITITSPVDTTLDHHGLDRADDLPSIVQGHDCRGIVILGVNIAESVQLSADCEHCRRTEIPF